MRKPIISGAMALLITVVGLSLTACQSSGTNGNNSNMSSANPSTQPSQQEASGYRSNIGNGAYGENVP
jgi:hypothetical protein